MNRRLQSFRPIAGADARVLILGSMPGAASLDAGRYYAHPRNAFWPIMGTLLAFDADADYDVRVTRLVAAGIAVWDVLRSCRREGSLDTSIEAPRPNDFRTFFRNHRQLERVFFNGAAAQTYFTRLVMPRVDVSHLRLVRLPSTSPAHAAFDLERKLASWRALVPGEIKAPRGAALPATSRRRARSRAIPPSPRTP